MFKTFHKTVKTQFQTNIQNFKTNNGTEYSNQLLENYFPENGIIHESSCVDTPQQNEVVERKNRHLLEVARSFTFSTKVPKYL